MSTASNIQKVQTRILSILPTHPHKISATEIKSRLGSDAPEDKTLQRYLFNLADDPVFGVERDERQRPYQYGYCKGHSSGLQTPTQSQAVTLQLAKQLLWDIFPKPMQDELAPLFQASDTVIKNTNPKLLKKLAVITPAQKFEPPVIKHNVRELIGEALYNDIAFEGAYRNADNVSKLYVFHPLAIVQRGATLYLIARANDYKNPYFYALHRFESVKILPSRKANSQKFSLKEYLDKGAEGFTQYGEAIKLVMRGNSDLVFYLKETPLSADQRLLKEDENGATIEASVILTEQLIWWLLSWSHGVEVISPKKLRTEIANRLQRAAAQYQS